MAGATQKKYGLIANMVLKVNWAVYGIEVLAHIRSQWVSFNEKGNLSALTKIAVISSMLLLLYLELLLLVAKR